jgi:hypothetical protein
MYSKSIIAGLLLMFAGNLGAEEARTNSPVWELMLHREAVPTIKPTFRAYLIAEKHKFAFFVPPELSAMNDAGKIKFLNAEGNCVMTLSVIGPVPEGGDLNTAACQERLLAEHTNAIVIGHVYRTAAGGHGPGFDLEWSMGERILVCQRTVYIPSSVGVLEFTATTTRANFPALRASLDSVLATFRADKDGKLETVHLSPNS